MTLGQPLEAMYGAFAPAERVDALCRRYRAHYAEHLADRTRPFPGVPELLAELGARGYLRTVASTKRTETARRLVEATGLGSARPRGGNRRGSLQAGARRGAAFARGGGWPGRLDGR